MYTPRQQQGISLIEVLITVILLTVGLLGVAGLHITGLQATGDALSRTEAMLLAQDMADRIRSNMQGANAGSYNGINTVNAYNSNCEGAEITCNSAQLATYDAQAWATEITNRLPAGQADINQNANIFTITVRWDGEKTGAAGLNCGLDKSVDLSCYQLVFRP